MTDHGRPGIKSIPGTSGPFPSLTAAERNSLPGRRLRIDCDAPDHLAKGGAWKVAVFWRNDGVAPGAPGGWHSENASRRQEYKEAGDEWPDDATPHMTTTIECPRCVKAGGGTKVQLRHYNLERILDRLVAAGLDRITLKFLADAVRASTE